MSCARQTCDIWFYIGKAIKDVIWRKYFFKDIKRCITSDYFWMDSFGQYLYRWILCPLFGHHKVQTIEYWDGSLKKDVKGPYCFHCDRPIKKQS